MSKSYKTPSKESLGINRKNTDGSVTAHISINEKAKRLVTIVFQAETNVAYINMHENGKQVFSTRVDEVARGPKTKSMRALVIAVAATGYVAKIKSAK